MKFVIKVHCNDNFPKFWKGSNAESNCLQILISIVIHLQGWIPPKKMRTTTTVRKEEKEKKKGSRAKNKKASENEMTVSVDTLTKAKGGKCQAILGVQQGSQKLS